MIGQDPMPGGTVQVPGITTGQYRVTSAYGEPGQYLPFTHAALNQQTVNRRFENAMGGPSRQQLLNSVRRDSSGLQRTSGDQIKINGALADRAGAGAQALAGTPYEQNLANAHALVGAMAGQGQDVVGKLGSLATAGQAAAQYNLSSLLSALDLGYGNNRATLGLIQPLLGGLLGGGVGGGV